MRFALLLMAFVVSVCSVSANVPPPPSYSPAKLQVTYDFTCDDIEASLTISSLRGDFDTKFVKATFDSRKVQLPKQIQLIQDSINYVEHLTASCDDASTDIGVVLSARPRASYLRRITIYMHISELGVEIPELACYARNNEEALELAKKDRVCTTVHGIFIE